MKRTFVALLVLSILNPAAANNWKQAQPDYAWSFPRDHWAHAGYKTEWWYFTGHLEGDDGRRFGYQFTFFRVGVLPTAPDTASAWTARDLIMGHAAISDLDGNDHRFSEVIYRAVPLLGGFGAWPDPLIAWSKSPAGTPGEWRLDVERRRLRFRHARRRAGHVLLAIHTARQAAGLPRPQRIQPQNAVRQRRQPVLQLHPAANQR